MRDTAATLAERFELLKDMATAQQAAGRLRQAHRGVQRAAILAESLNDDVRIGELITLAVDGQIWLQDDHSPHRVAWGAILSRFMARLPAGDSALRCRTLILQAVECYATADSADLDRWCEQAVAMAERLGDPDLTLICLRGSLLALRRPATAQIRMAHNERLIACARSVGDQQTVELGAAVRVALLAECGEIEQMAESLPQAMAMAEQRRLWSIWPALALLHSSCSGLRGDHQTAAETLEHVHQTTSALALTQFRPAEVFTRLLNPYWAGESDLPGLDLAELPNGLQMAGTMLVAVLKARIGDLDDALRFVRGNALPVGGNDFRSMFTTCLSAELAARTGDTNAGAAALRWLEPYTGRLGALGSTCPLGPVDSFIALACDAAGDQRGDEFAARAADLSRAWAVPSVADWLAGARRERA